MSRVVRVRAQNVETGTLAELALTMILPDAPHRKADFSSPLRTRLKEPEAQCDRLRRRIAALREEGDAAHLDLVQEATDPTWSWLKAKRPDEAETLLKTDLAFLLRQIEAFPLQVIVCDGRTVLDEVSRILADDIRERGDIARIRWYAGEVLK